MTRRGASAAATLFCIPGAGASASFYRQWLDHVPPSLEVKLLELPGHGMRLDEPHPQSVERAVEEMLHELRPQLRAPFAIFGHSMGSIFAYELTHSLERENLRPHHLFVAAFVAPRSGLRSPLSSTTELSDAAFLAMARRTGFVAADISRSYDTDLMNVYLPPLRKDILMLDTYRHDDARAPLSVPITVFGGADDSMVPASSLESWRDRTTAGCTIRMHAGDHFFVRGAGDTLQLEIEEVLTRARSERAAE